MKSRRLDEITKYVNEKKSATINELADNFNVSVITVRRDITELEKLGEVKKVYGGVMAVKPEQAISYEERFIKNKEKKDHIAKLAAKNIENYESIFIDSGTTTANILDYVDRDIDITLFTNNLDIINKCENFPNIKLYIVGYIYNSETRSFVGESQYFKMINLDKSFLSASGIHLKNGATTIDFDENIIKTYVVKKSNKNYLLADKSKFGSSTMLTFADLKDINTILTNDSVADEFKDYFLENNINLKY